MRSGSETQNPSSEKTRTRAREPAMAPSSASRSPCRPTVTAPMGCTVAKPAASPSASSCSTTPAVSATGAVFAIANTAVNPPAAAARVPVRIVSLCS